MKIKGFLIILSIIFGFLICNPSIAQEQARDKMFELTVVDSPKDEKIKAAHIQHKVNEFFGDIVIKITPVLFC